MDIHNIHGVDVGFHGNAKDAVDFLKKGVHGDTARDYFKEAERHGEAFFIGNGGEKFKIRSSNVEGKTTFSIEKHDHHY